jgi:hypothetical protein
MVKLSGVYVLLKNKLFSCNKFLFQISLIFACYVLQLSVAVGTQGGQAELLLSSSVGHLPELLPAATSSSSCCRPPV